MATLSYKDLQAEVRTGKVGPLYLFSGDEAFLREKAVQMLMEAALDPGTRAFNLDVFRCGETDPGEIASRILSFPMMASRRVVIVKDCEEIQDGPAGVLLPLLVSPPETTTAVFVCGKVDGRRKFFATLRKYARVVEFKPLRERDVLTWVQDRLDAEGKRPTQEALRLLHERLGTDLGIASGEIAKLLSFVGDREAIGREDVDQVVGSVGDASVFDLTDAVGARDAGRALVALRRVLEGGERGTGILWQLTRHFHTLMKVRICKEARVAVKDLPSQIGLPPFVISKCLQQSRNFTAASLWRNFELLVTAEDQMKSGYQTEEIVLQLLVMGLCR